MISIHAIATCDRCLTTEDLLASTTPPGIRQEIKSLGWSIRSVKYQQTHLCPDCTKSDAKKSKPKGARPT